MAMAAKCTLVEIEGDIVELGDMDPNHVHTPRHFRRPGREDPPAAGGAVDPAVRAASIGHRRSHDDN